jgi:hypothetical protein
MGFFGTCCKVIFLSLTTLLGLTGVTMVLYGGVNVFEVDLQDAQNGKVYNEMIPFIKCPQQADKKLGEITLGASADKSEIRDLLIASCTYQYQSSGLAIFAMAGVFSLFAILSGLVAGCREVKGNLYAYTVLSGVSIALLIVAISMMAGITAGTVSKFAPCDAYSNATATVLEKSLGYTCVSWKHIADGSTIHTVAVKWSATISVFYAGAVLTILALLSFLMMNSCASSQTTFEKANINNRKHPDNFTPLDPQNQNANYGQQY